MRVLIVGGGIGGLCTALACDKAGVDWLIVEQAQSFTAVGAGIGLGASAMKVLTHLGVDDRVRDMGVFDDQQLYLDLATGERIAQRQLLGDRAAARFGDGHYSVFRPDLIDALATRLPADRVRLAARLVAIDETADAVTAVLEDGERLSGDVLVGADGLKSRVRIHLFGEQEPKFTGVQGWRTVFPRSALPEGLPAAEGLCIWMGRNRSATMYPIRDDLVYSGAFAPAAEIHEESWTSEGGIEQLRAAFTGACDAIQATIDVIEKSAQTLFLTSLFYRDPLPSWSRGRITLLGDAAHPCPPSTGQGAAMAIEDAYTLAACLSKPGADIAAALREYEQRRLPRTRRLLATALPLQRLVAIDDPVEIRAAHGRFRGLERLDPLGEAQFGWIVAHDPIEAMSQSPADAARADGALPCPLERAEARRAFQAWQDALTAEDHAAGWIGERTGYERFLGELSGSSRDVRVEEVSAGGVPALWVGDGPVTVLHVHGGGYTMGSARSSVGLAYRLSRALGARVLVPDYRLGPEHPYPAALDDVQAAYEWLATQGAQTVVLTGECAGGGLAVALALRLRDNHGHQPAAIAAFSPFADLTLRSPSIDANSGRDGWFTRNSLIIAAASYLHGHDPADPDVSPLHADLTGLAPMIIHAACDEVLADDARRLAALAGEAGVPVELHLKKDTVHSFVLFDTLSEAHETLRSTADFIRPHLAARDHASGR